MIFIDKPSGGYRPIALSNTWLKITERIINDRLQWWIESKGILPKQFSGFRRSRSCNDCLAVLHADAFLAERNKQYLGVLSLDLEGAYESVNLLKLCKILKSLKVPTAIIHFIFNTIKQRELEGVYNGVSFAHGRTNKGLPQGSILSPLLFNIYMYYILHHVHYNSKVLSFADDFLIYSAHSDPVEIIVSLQNSIDNLLPYLSSLNMKLAQQKCNLIIISKTLPLIPVNSYTLNISNRIIENINKIKYLGVIIDNRLSWSDHISHISIQAKRGLAMLNYISKKAWGAHPSTLLLFYKTIVRPRLDWGCLLFNNAQKQTLNKLNVIQNAGLRISMGCIRTTPINFLHHLTGIPTLTSRRFYLTSKYIVTLTHTYNN